MELKKGINLGGYLSQCIHTQEHYDSFIGEKDIALIKHKGFDHVRLPIDYNVLEDEDGNFKEVGFETVYRVIDWCMSHKLNIVLDLHKAPGYDFNDAGDSESNNLFNSEVLQQRYLDLWQEIAKHFHGYEHVAFELLNEVVESENADKWNKLIKRAVATIRAIAPTTPIIYGGIKWNSADTLQFLDVPEDENIIFTFHFYEPLVFTHQKAHWMTEQIDQHKDMHYPATLEDYREACDRLGIQGQAVLQSGFEMIGIDYLESLMVAAIEAAEKAHVGLYCGEFGVIDQAPALDTLNWFEDVFALFKKHDIGYSIWTYKNMDFGLNEDHYDTIRDRIFDN